MQDNLLGWKIGSGILLLFLTIFFGIIPFLLRWIKHPRFRSVSFLIIDVVNSFSGGVLLAVGLLHVLGIFSKISHQ